MSTTWARPCAACVLAVIAVSGSGPGGKMAHALDAPADANSKAARAATAAASRKPARDAAIKARVPPPPAQSDLPHPAGWPAVPIGGGAANRGVAASPGAPLGQSQNHDVESAASATPEPSPDADEQNFFQRMIRARTRAIESEPNEPRRRELADPPDGYRRQAPSPSDAVEQETNKSRGILGAIGALLNGGNLPGKDDEPDSAAAAPKPAPNASEAGGLLGKIGGMLPAFLRGSDKK